MLPEFQQLALNIVPHSSIDEPGTAGSENADERM